jgi:hypothetical protein
MKMFKFNLIRAALIFSVGLVTRILVNSTFGIDVFVNYENYISMAYYWLMAIFSVSINGILNYFGFMPMPISGDNLYLQSCKYCSEIIKKFKEKSILLLSDNQNPSSMSLDSTSGTNPAPATATAPGPAAASNPVAAPGPAAASNPAGPGTGRLVGPAGAPRRGAINLPNPTGLGGIINIPDPSGIGVRGYVQGGQNQPYASHIAEAFQNHYDARSGMNGLSKPDMDQTAEAFFRQWAQIHKPSLFDPSRANRVYPNTRGVRDGLRKC